MSDELQPKDGTLELARLVGDLIAWALQARIQIAAHRIALAHLGITQDDWNEAVAKAKSEVPADLKAPPDTEQDPEALHTFLKKLSLP
jgi:hypothetical protein